MKAWTLAALLIAAVLAERVVARPDGAQDGAQDDDEEIQDDEPANEDGPSPPAGPPPKILTSQQILTRKVGESVILPCQVENVPTVVWLNKSLTLAVNNLRLTFKDDNRLTFRPDHTLEIKNLTLFDAGEYTCKVNDGLQIHHQLVLNGAPVTRISLSLLLGVALLLTRS